MFSFCFRGGFGLCNKAGETLRGILLGDGYAYWTFGMMALYASLAALAGAVVMAVLVTLGCWHLKRLS